MTTQRVAKSSPFVAIQAGATAFAVIVANGTLFEGGDLVVMTIASAALGFIAGIVALVRGEERRREVDRQAHQLFMGSLGRFAKVGYNQARANYPVQSTASTLAAAKMRAQAQIMQQLSMHRASSLLVPKKEEGSDSGEPQGNT